MRTSSSAARSSRTAPSHTRILGSRRLSEGKVRSALPLATEGTQEACLNSAERKPTRYKASIKNQLYKEIRKYNSSGFFVLFPLPSLRFIAITTLSTNHHDLHLLSLAYFVNVGGRCRVQQSFVRHEGHSRGCHK